MIIIKNHRFMPTTHQGFPGAEMARVTLQRFLGVDSVRGHDGVDPSRTDRLQGPTGMHDPKGMKLVAEEEEYWPEHPRRTARLAERLWAAAKVPGWSETTTALWWRWAGGMPDAEPRIGWRPEIFVEGRMVAQRRQGRPSRTEPRHPLALQPRASRVGHDPKGGHGTMPNRKARMKRESSFIRHALRSATQPAQPFPAGRIMMETDGETGG